MAPSFTINIELAPYLKLRDQLIADGVLNAQTNLLVNKDVTLSPSYDASAQVLTVAIIKKPWIATNKMVENKVRELIQKALAA